MRIIRFTVLAITAATVLACGGLLDDDVRQCTWRSDKVCAEHFEQRFSDPSLDNSTREQGRVLVHAACERGEPAACRVYGIEIGFERPGFAARVADGLEALEKACATKHEDACFQIARLSSMPGPEQNLARSHEVYWTLCDAGGPASCNNLGYLIERGSGVTPDPAKAAELYEKSCSLGDDLACSNIALMLDLGRGVPQDKARAQSVWEGLCSKELPKDCFRLANSLRDTNRDDLTRPTALTEGACNDGFQPACVTLGFDYSQGRGREASPETALAVWMKACDSGEGEACDGAAVAYDHGSGVPEDKAAAKDLFRRGCELEYGGACFNLSIHTPDEEPRLVELACRYGSSRGCNDHGVNEIKKGNQANARDAYAKACDLGSDVACKNLGYNLEKKDPIDYQAAFKAYSIACDRGMAEVCRTAASMLKDRTEAKVWYRKGCAQGDKPSCKKM